MKTQPPLTVTLRKIRRHNPCEDGWKKLLKHLGKTKADTEPLSLLTILDSNGIDDAIWCLHALPETEDWRVRLFAVACADQVKHLMTDKRSIAALDVSRRYALGFATIDELSMAYAAAYYAATDAARGTAYAAARGTAYAAARGKSRDKQRTLFLAYFCAPLPKGHYVEYYKNQNKESL